MLLDLSLCPDLAAEDPPAELAPQVPTIRWERCVDAFVGVGIGEVDEPPDYRGFSVRREVDALLLGHSPNVNLDRSGKSAPYGLIALSLS